MKESIRKKYKAPECEDYNISFSQAYENDYHNLGIHSIPKLWSS